MAIRKVTPKVTSRRYLVTAYVADQPAFNIAFNCGVTDILYVYRRARGSLYTVHDDIMAAAAEAQALNDPTLREANSKRLGITLTAGIYWVVWQTGQQPDSITLYPIRED